ncbi:MAG TPA: hypothetical protein VG826_02635 [Pirellulales bacterium]|nr:hypothetical protein [Pirellulales bacterium]
MPDHAIDRRNFAARLTGAAAALGGAYAVADEPKKAEAPDLTAVASTELLLELIKRVDPERLKAEHLDLLRADLLANLQRSARLSAFPLTNADEPAPVFAAWRSEG